MSLVSMLKGKGPSGFGYGSTAEEVTEGVDLTGKTILLTGCNSGIGKESLRVLGLRGAHVIAAARTVSKAQAALTETGADGTPVACELSEPSSVRACVGAVTATEKRIDAIVCNAGIMALPERKVAHGYELQFFTNHVGHFMLVTGLLEQLTDAARVVVVSSEGHRMPPAGGIEFDNLSAADHYSAVKNYGQSKLANILFANALAKRFEGTSKTANSLHPGVIHTNLTRSMNPVVGWLSAAFSPLTLKSIPEGAATQCYLAASPAVAGVTGKYFADVNEAKPSAFGRDEALAERLWEVSEKIVAELS